MIAGILVIAALHYGREILVPFVLAILITFLLAPVVRRLELLGSKRILAAGVVVLVTLALVGSLTYALTWQLVDVANALPNYRSNIRAKLEAIRSPGQGPLARATENLKDIGRELSAVPEKILPARPQSTRRNQPKLPPDAQEPVKVQVTEPPTSGLGYIRELIGPILTPLANVVIVVVFVVFMLLERENLRNRVLRLAGEDRLNVMTEAIDDAAQRVSKYIAMQFLVNLAYGTLFGVGLFVIGVPNALLWGVLGGMLRFVPYVGTMAGAALPLMMALAVFDGWERPLFVVGLFLFLELTIANFIEPWLYGAHTGISSVAILLAAIAWAALWGPLGLVLATPLTVCLVVMGRYLPQLEFLYVLLGDEHALTPDARLYQRLLAMDEREARNVVESFLEDHTVSEFYDAVLIPAVVMAERDGHEGSLDETRRRFFDQGVSELVAELGERPQVNHPQLAEPATLPHLACFPASDKGDEVVTAIFAQLAQKEGYVPIAFPCTDSPAELVNDPQAIVFVSAVQPFGLSAARNVCKQVREKNPQQKIVVGVWGDSQPADQVRQRVGMAHCDAAVTTLAEALEALRTVQNPPEQPAVQLIDNALLSSS